MKNRCISEGGRLISDLLEMNEVLNKEGFLVITNIEKAFDSVHHHFLIAILEKIRFGTEFIELIKVLLNNQKSCVINGGKTSKYFKLEKGTRQGDPISANLFIYLFIFGFCFFLKKFYFFFINKHNISQVSLYNLFTNCNN